MNYRYQFRIFKLLFFLAGLIFLMACSTNTPKIEVQVSSPSTTDGIYLPEDSLVIPVTYDTLVSLFDLSINERKEKFIALVLPSILITRFRLQNNLNRVKAITAGDTSGLKRRDKQFINLLKIKYKTSDLAELEKRLLPHPASIVIAQAAIESAWGTSRFFMEANNVFGVWSFNLHEPRIIANGSRNGTPIYLKKYISLLAAVEDYFLVTAKGPYEDFRNKRAVTQNVFELLPTLTNYSELKAEYIKNLEKIIIKNNLTKFDTYQIDPEYISSR